MDRRDKKDKKFICNFAKEAIMHARKTKEEIGQLAMIMRCGEKKFSKIAGCLSEINQITSNENVGVGVHDAEKREIRIFYLSE